MSGECIYCGAKTRRFRGEWEHYAPGLESVEPWRWCRVTTARPETIRAALDGPQ